MISVITLIAEMLIFVLGNIESLALCQKVNFIIGMREKEREMFLAVGRVVLCLAFSMAIIIL